MSNAPFQYLQSPASSTETKRERSKSENSEDNPKEEPTESVEEAKQPSKSPEETVKDSTKSEDSKPPHPLLDQVKNLIGTSKAESQMKIDPEGKQLQIDDLIIIPNNISSTPPEGGSALQNLAKIASRYQNQPKDIIEVSAPKKAKVEEPVKPSPMPPSTSASMAPSAASLAALAAMNPMTMTPAQQQSLFAMLQHPSLFGMPNKTPSTPSKGGQGGTSSAASAASLYSPFFGDPSKLGPEALKLLQMFDSSLKAAVGGSSQGSSASGVPSSKSGSSPKPRNASGSSTNTSSSPSTSSSAKDARSKVTRLPMDAKRPPALQGHSPCAFAQTSNIYTNPFVDLNKAKESSSANSDGALDLTRNAAAPARQLAPPVPPLMGGGGGGINLRKESSLKANPMLDLTPRRNEVKVSPFSAEALLSKSSSSSSAAPGHTGSSSSRPPSHHSHHQKVDLGNRMTPSSREPSEKSSKSPWHTPVNTQARPTQPTKPAIPVSPVVREDKSKPDMSFQAALLGLGGVAPPSATSGGGGSAAAAAAAAAAAGLPLPPTSYGSLSAATNPYLAMAQAAQGLPKTSTAAAQAAAAAAATPSFPASHMMDPTSAYYAALYSQSLYAGMSPYAGMRLPGLPPTPSAPPAPPAAPPAGTMPPGMDLLTLHAMMSRGQTPSSANPFAGYPPGLLGFPGFPGQPHSSGRKDP